MSDESYGHKDTKYKGKVHLYKYIERELILFSPPCSSLHMCICTFVFQKKIGGTQEGKRKEVLLHTVINTDQQRNL